MFNEGTIYKGVNDTKRWGLATAGRSRPEGERGRSVPQNPERAAATGEGDPSKLCDLQ